ncbi:MAG: selenium metabolism-associated LysR family transcriptional regulator [Desulfitobacteriaceae bacterium]
MKLNHLRIFYAVAKAQSFSKAADEIYVSQPSISVQVKNLEQELGVKLFRQVGKKIVLTEIGGTVFQYAKKVFNLVDELDACIYDYKGLTRGRLLVGASTTPGIYILPKILGQFRKAFPGIETILDIGNSQEIENKILTDQIEIALVGEKIYNSNLESKIITHDNLVVVVSVDHELAKSKFVTLEDILNEPFVVREPGSSTRIALERRLQELGRKIKINMQFGSLEAIKQAVAANLGISVLSRFVVDQEVCSGNLHILHIPELEISREISVVFHKEKKLSVPSTAFLRLLKDNLAPHCS